MGDCLSKHTFRDKIPIVLFIIASAIFLYIVWLPRISIETKYIPTIINGLTSAVSLILAVTSASIALSSRNVNKSRGYSSSAHVRFLFIVMAPVLILLFAYIVLIAADYYLALKSAITSFIISLVILFVYLDRIAVVS